jgi:hypothetical protein
MYGFIHSEWACSALFCETYDNKRLHVRAAFKIRDIRLNYKPVCQAFYSTELRVMPIANTEPQYNGRSSYTTTTDVSRNRETRKWQMHNTENEVTRNSNIVKREDYITFADIAESRYSNTIKWAYITTRVRKQGIMTYWPKNHGKYRKYRINIRNSGVLSSVDS